MNKSDILELSKLIELHNKDYPKNTLNIGEFMNLVGIEESIKLFENRNGRRIDMNKNDSIPDYVFPAPIK